MLSREYLESSKRHLYICMKLCDHIADDKSNFSHYASVIYYLSGYIFEGVICYMAYKKLNWETKDVYALDTTDWVFKRKSDKDTRNQICVHKYTALLTFIGYGNPDFDANLQKILSNYNSSNRFNTWSTSYRYKCYGGLTNMAEVAKYVEFCKNMYVFIRNLI